MVRQKGMENGKDGLLRIGSVRFLGGGDEIIHHVVEASSGGAVVVL